MTEAIRRVKPKGLPYEFSGARATERGLIDREGSDELERNGLWSHWKERYKEGWRMGKTHTVLDELNYNIKRLEESGSLNATVLKDIAEHFRVATDVDTKHNYALDIDRESERGSSWEFSHGDLMRGVRLDYAGAKTVSKKVLEALAAHGVDDVVDLPTEKLQTIVASYKSPATAVRLPKLEAHSKYTTSASFREPVKREIPISEAIQSLKKTSNKKAFWDGVADFFGAPRKASKPSSSKA